MSGTRRTEAKSRVRACCSWLPEHKPRYVMGVGYPEDLVVCIALGADMFDCVWPSRTAVSPPLILTLAPTPPFHKLTPPPPPPAIRQRPNPNRHPLPPPLHPPHLLPPHLPLLHLPLLPARFLWRAGHHAGLYPPRRCQGDCWCAFVRPPFPQPLPFYSCSGFFWALLWAVFGSCSGRFVAFFGGDGDGWLVWDVMLMWGIG